MEHKGLRVRPNAYFSGQSKKKRSQLHRDLFNYNILKI